MAQKEAKKLESTSTSTELPIISNRNTARMSVAQLKMLLIMPKLMPKIL